MTVTEWQRVAIDPHGSSTGQKFDLVPSFRYGLMVAAQYSGDTLAPRAPTSAVPYHLRMENFELMRLQPIASLKCALAAILWIPRHLLATQMFEIIR